MVKIMWTLLLSDPIFWVAILLPAMGYVSELAANSPFVEPANPAMTRHSLRILTETNNERRRFSPVPPDI